MRRLLRIVSAVLEIECFTLNEMSIPCTAIYHARFGSQLENNLLTLLQIRIGNLK